MNLVRPSFAIIGAVVAVLTTSPASSDEFTDCARGFAAIARGFDDIAIHYCSQVLRSPRFSEAQKSRALDFRAAAYRDSAQDQTAFDDLESAAARLPATFENLVVLALIQVRGGQLDAAAASFSAALAANPNDPRVHYNRGLVFYFMERHADAIADYERSLQLSPDVADTHYNLGLAYFDSGDMGAAIESYGRSIALVPSYAQAFHNRGHADARIGESALARNDFRRAVELAPEDPVIASTARTYRITR